MIAGGAGGRRVLDSAARVGLRILSGSAQLARSSQVREPKADKGTSGAAGLRAQKGRDRNARRERWLPPAQRLTRD